jgi:imidazolonepropionase-like amidohydrolase
MPGLIDSHVHLCLDGSADPLNTASKMDLPALTLMAASQAEKTLKAGITTVRDLGGVSGVDLAIRDAVNKGQIKGPGILASAKPLCITGGHGWLMGRQADGPDEFRKAAREQLKAGADVVKIISTGGVLTLGVEPGSAQACLEEQKAAVEEAHKAGRKTASHAQGTQGILNSLKAGIDSIEHGFFLDDESIDLMKQNQVFLVPTIAALHFISEKGVESGIPAPFVEKARNAMEAHKMSIQRAKLAGVPIAMGTDAGTPFNLHGQNAYELKLMVDYGFSAHEAIMAATSQAARLLGQEGDLGVVAKGKQADLLLVKGDPLLDVELLSRPENISQVFKAGEPVS